MADMHNPEPLTQFLTQADGVRTAYQVYGGRAPKDSTPLLLIGGITNTKEDWHALLPALVFSGATEREVCCFDNMGMGESSAPDAKSGIYSLPAMAKHGLALADLLGWQKFDVLGFSMGEYGEEPQFFRILLMLHCMLRRHDRDGICLTSRGQKPRAPTGALRNSPWR